MFLKEFEEQKINSLIYADCALCHSLFGFFNFLGDRRDTGPPVVGPQSVVEGECNKSWITRRALESRAEILRVPYGKFVNSRHDYNQTRDDLAHAENVVDPHVQLHAGHINEGDEAECDQGDQFQNVVLCCIGHLFQTDEWSQRLNGVLSEGENDHGDLCRS